MLAIETDLCMVLTQNGNVFAILDSFQCRDLRGPLHRLPRTMLRSRATRHAGDGGQERGARRSAARSHRLHEANGALREQRTHAIPIDGGSIAAMNKPVTPSLTPELPWRHSARAVPQRSRRLVPVLGYCATLAIGHRLLTIWGRGHRRAGQLKTSRFLQRTGVPRRLAPVSPGNRGSSRGGDTCVNSPRRAARRHSPAVFPVQR